MNEDTERQKKIQEIIITEFSNFVIILFKHIYKYDIKVISSEMIYFNNDYYLVRCKDDGKLKTKNIITYKSIKGMIKEDNYDQLIHLCTPTDTYEKVLKYYLVNDCMPNERDDPKLYKEMKSIMLKYKCGFMSENEIGKYESGIPIWKWDHSIYSIKGMKYLSLYNAIKNGDDLSRSEKLLLSEVRKLYKLNKLPMYFMTLFSTIDLKK
jgi:hypothetical protein